MKYVICKNDEGYMIEERKEWHGGYDTKEEAEEKLETVVAAQTSTVPTSGIFDKENSESKQKAADKLKEQNERMKKNQRIMKGLKK